MEPLPALKPLLMDAKPLSELMNQDSWVDLAARLKKAFPAPPKGSANSNEVIHLCRVFYAHKQERFVSSYGYAYVKRVTKAVFDQLTSDTLDFLKEFMDVRGQWRYLENQAWYTNREYVIAIDVNYYPDRSSSMYTMSPLFHKDTGGNNLFVNLIFDNKQPIESTEWFVDIQEPGGKRKEWQDSLLPPAHVKELAALRQVLQESREYQTPVIHGGVIKGENVFVSWVDDLVWHATPSVNNRIEYTAKAAIAAYQSINLSIQQGGTFMKEKVRIHPVELLATMADDPETALFLWLKERNKGIQDVDFELARAAWAALYTDDAGLAKFTHDAELRGRASWRLLGQVAQSNAPDTRLDEGTKKAPDISETPAGLSKLRRANSLDSAATEELKAVAAANEKLPRSFLRTWVRILPKNAKELTDVGFTFQ